MQSTHPLRGFFVRTLVAGVALACLAACALLPERTGRLIDGSTAPMPAALTAGAPPLPAAAPPTGEPIALDGAARLTPFVRQGTGRVVEAVGGRSSAPTLGSSEGGTLLNFVGVDVREVVQTILGDRLAATYTIDPAVTGPVTLRSSRPLADDALLGVLEDVLAANGAALVRDGGGYRVVPRDQAPRGARARIGRTLPGAEPGYGVQIVPLSFVGAAEMQALLEPVARQGAVLRADPARNLLVLGGAREDLAALLDLVDAFDVDWMAGRSVGLFPLVSASVEAVVEELDTIFGPGADGAVAPSPSGTGGPRFVAVRRLNAVLAVAPRPSQLSEARTWIQQLDRETAGDDPRLYTYAVQNGRASDLAVVIGRVFGVSPGAGAQQPEPGADVAPGLSVSERVFRQPSGGSGGTQGASGARQGGAQPAGSPPGGGAALGAGAGSSTVFGARQNRGRPGAQGSQQTVLIGGDGTNGGRPVRITADDGNNALVVLASPRDYRLIDGALRRLDVRPLQVLIEATIAEVTLNDQLRFGLQYFFRSGNFDFVLSDVDTGTVNPLFPGFGVLNRPANARFALSALEQITDLNVISSPQLMVLNNQTAALQVGDQVPVPVQSAVSVLNPDAPTVNTIQYRDTGVILYVTPRVNSNGLVTLDIAQEVSDVVRTTSSGIDAPTIQQRRIESTVAVGSGETVALGGLIRDARTRGRTGIPILSSIPVLGALFSTIDNTAGRTELLVLITPRVVRDGRDARDITDELRRRLRALGPT